MTSDSTPTHEQLAELLNVRYGLATRSYTLEVVNAGVRRTHVELRGNARVVVTRYPPDADLEAVRTSCRMTQSCYAAGLPVPEIWADRDGDLLTVHGDATWRVTEEMPGQASRTPLSRRQAEQIGRLLGRLHRHLAKYPHPVPDYAVPRPADNPETISGPQDGALSLPQTRVESENARAGTPYSRQQEDLTAGIQALRAGLPNDLLVQPLHGNISRRQILLLEGEITALVGFRAHAGPVAWELGRLAFDPLTVATRRRWPNIALAFIDGYREEHPAVPPTDLAACPRIALLDLLFSLPEATRPNSSSPVNPVGGREREHRLLAIRRLSAGLAGLEHAIVRQAARPHQPRLALVHTATKP